jgi:hypothetical protein
VEVSIISVEVDMVLIPATEDVIEGPEASFGVFLDEYGHFWFATPAKEPKPDTAQGPYPSVVKAIQGAEDRVRDLLFAIREER